MTTGRLKPTEPADAAKIGAGLADLLGARLHVDVTIPRTTIAGAMRLVDRTESLAIKAATRKVFQAAGLITEAGNVVETAVDDWNAEIGVRHLALAVRDPSNHAKPLDSLDEWRQCDDDQIAGLWNRYQDLREELDPLGANEDTLKLSAADLEMMRAASKKKEHGLLMSFGSRKLAAFAIISAEPPAP